MSMPVDSTGGGMPLFTIEQIELIRRLRNSGITKEQVVQAFDSLNRIDSELGHLYTIPQSLASAFTKTSPLVPQSGSRLVPHVENHVLSQTLHQPIRKALTDRCQLARASSTTEMVAVKRRRQSSGDDDEGREQPSDTSFEDQDIHHPHGVDEELKVRLEEFMRLPAPKRLDEILTMVSVAGVRVPDIANKTGLSKSTISRFLQGETIDISTNQKRSIYLWYLRQVQKTEGSFMSATSPISTSRSLSSQGSGHSQVMQLLPRQELSQTDIGMMERDMGMKMFEYPGRRERFIFREKHLEVLAEAFRTNQYPSSEEREEIAQRCNEAMKTVTGKELSERQTVTCYIVSNWFNNRRKEIKRIARDEGIACSDVVLPCKSKPRSILQQSPTDMDSQFSLINEESTSAEQDTETNHLDPATINKLLYDLTEKNMSVKLEPPDRDNSD